MLKDLKVVFMGTPEFSVNILSMLINNTNVIGVVTKPDKVVGRKKEVTFSPIKSLALKNNIKVLQPVKIKEDYQDILTLKPDIIITAAYGQIVPKEVLDYPKYGCINVHASLLPKLRGGAPIHHAIIDGYHETGITIMYMDPKMDSGDIIKQASTSILEDDTYQTLHDKLSILGTNLLKEVLPSIIANTNDRIKQDESEVTYAYNIDRKEEILDFNSSKEEIYNKIRGLNPNPGSYFLLDGKTIKVYKSLKIDDFTYQDKINGEIVEVSKDSFSIKTKNGLLKILEIKPEGKSKMLVSSYLNGNKNILGKVVNRS